MFAGVQDVVGAGAKADVGTVEIGDDGVDGDAAFQRQRRCVALRIGCGCADGCRLRRALREGVGGKGEGPGSATGLVGGDSLIALVKC